MTETKEMLSELVNKVASVAAPTDDVIGFVTHTVDCVSCVVRMNGVDTKVALSASARHGTHGFLTSVDLAVQGGSNYGVVTVGGFGPTLSASVRNGLLVGVAANLLNASLVGVMMDEPVWVDEQAVSTEDRTLKVV